MVNHSSFFTALTASGTAVQDPWIAALPATLRSRLKAKRNDGHRGGDSPESPTENAAWLLFQLANLPVHRDHQVMWN